MTPGKAYRLPLIATSDTPPLATAARSGTHRIGMIRA